MGCASSGVGCARGAHTRHHGRWTLPSRMGCARRCANATPGVDGQCLIRSGLCPTVSARGTKSGPMQHQELMGWASSWTVPDGAHTQVHHQRAVPTRAPQVHHRGWKSSRCIRNGLPKHGPNGEHTTGASPGWKGNPSARNGVPRRGLGSARRRAHHRCIAKVGWAIASSEVGI